jgi:signal transduction histidine kinase
LLFTISTAVAILLGLFFWLYLSKRKTNVQLKEKNKTISNINTQKDKFFSIIAHDLRGPFNGFLGLTELLVNDLDFMTNEEIQFAAGSMKSSANNLNRLLENLLEWSRMEQGLIAFKPQEYKLKSVVDECVLTFKDIAQKKAIKINYSIDEEITVFADNNILHAVVRNILSNAVKFTPKGGNVIIQVNEDDTNTTISITDSGIGMNPKMVENLFRLDVQTNRKGTNDEPSTGLGLILCKEFVEKHNGEIWLESVEEQGTTFYFSFPKALR